MVSKAKKKVKKQKAAPERLPRWDLTHFYKSIEDPKIAADIKTLERLVGTFVSNYQGKLKSADKLAQSVKDFEKIEDKAGYLSSYAQLLYAVDMKNATVTQFYQNTQERLTKILSKLVFYTLEINQISNADFSRYLDGHATLSYYKPWLDHVRAYKPYQLSHELEEYIHETSVTMDAWQRLFDESLARLTFTIAGKKLSEAEAIDLLSSKNGKKRKKAAHEIARVFEKNAPTFALVTNTLAKAKEIDDIKRGFSHPISSRNVENQVEDEVVEALVATVKANYGNLAHRYYKWKAKQFGKKALNYWDRNAPLPSADDRKIPWEEAKKIVLDSYRAFSPDMADIANRFFKEKWIDVPVRDGKDSGAFSHGTVPSAHPYILVNYQGKVRDVMTLAHELGHGVHQVCRMSRVP